jgi:2-succinyl-5-enolpyruvyl-6-hydroxy-3-cyclohexene-1-carboxylate synthase
VGDALVAENSHRVTLVTGDIAFIYDLNGLATVQELPKNLRIVVINNGGGEIFRWLDGPIETGLVDKYFETKPKTSIKTAAEYCGLDYFCATDVESTIMGMEQLNNTKGPSILEVKTDAHISTSVYKSILSKES